MHTVIVVVGLATAWLVPSPATGHRLFQQDAPQAKFTEEDLAFEIAEIRDRFVKGDYEVVLKKITKLRRDVPATAPAGADLLKLQLRAQSYSRNREAAAAVARELLQTIPGDPSAHAALGDLEASKGNYDAALDLYKNGLAAGKSFLLLGRVTRTLELKGEFDAAAAAARANFGEVTSLSGFTPEELLEAGMEAERAGSLEDASTCFANTERMKKEKHDDPLVFQNALVALGNLYQKVYRNVAGRPNGEREFNQVLKENPYHYDALLARYRLGRANFALDESRSQERSEDCLNRAREMDSSDPQLFIYNAQAMIPDRRFEEARKELTKVISSNPRHLEARVELAALDYLQKKADGYEAFRKEDLAARPASSWLPRVLGTYLKNLYRFGDAIPVLEDAVRRNAKDGDAWTALGECYAHQAREKEALDALRKAESAEEGFVHPWRSNMIQVLEVIESKYLTIPSRNFVFKLHPECEPVLREMLPPFYEMTRSDYGARYGYVPTQPVQIEVFRRFDDFSVRSVGFAGFGALGVCFGPLITAVSPLAEEFRSNFSYLDTAWHEYAHVVHLALSRGRVPRWFTEGLATLEEKKRNPGFDRHMELDLLEARATGNIYPIMELNSAFRGPRIIFGYYQGGLICEYLEKKTSAARFVDALKMFGEDAPLDDVIQKSFGMTVAELDAGFLKFVDEKLSRVKVRPTLDEPTIRKHKRELNKNPGNAEAARALAWACVKRGNVADAEVFAERLKSAAPADPDLYLLRAQLSLLRKREDLAMENFKKGFDGGAEEFFSRMQYAQLLMGKKDYENTKLQLRKAMEAFPEFADERQSPRVLLARMLAAEEKFDESTALLEELCKISGTALEARAELASRYEAANDASGIARVLGEILEVDPFQRDVQRRRALALLQLKQFKEAALAARLAGNVDPAREPQPRPKPGQRPEPPKSRDPAKDKLERAECAAIEAEALLGAGDADGAREALAKALRLDPDNERAAALKPRVSPEVK